ncbi:MAG: hypothetical protein GKR92_07100 [Gammaproteobacteria bacterium]|nr:MAG: hypothetical protein GKR92_07100 [Gammaproteobacteria bacterium]
MQLVNILLTIGLIVLVSGITVLSLCAIIASSRSDQTSLAGRDPSNLEERRRNTSCSFPLTCEDGTMVYFERRLQT